nr:hypothetical protein [Microvirga roseola]
MSPKPLALSLGRNVEQRNLAFGSHVVAVSQASRDEAGHIPGLLCHEQ